jgi:hypothetical protein
VLTVSDSAAARRTAGDWPSAWNPDRAHRSSTLPSPHIPGRLDQSLYNRIRKLRAPDADIVESPLRVSVITNHHACIHATSLHPIDRSLSAFPFHSDDVPSRLDPRLDSSPRKKEPSPVSIVPEIKAGNGKPRDR